MAIALSVGEDAVAVEENCHRVGVAIMRGATGTRKPSTVDTMESIILGCNLRTLTPSA